MPYAEPSLLPISLQMPLPVKLRAFPKSPNIAPYLQLALRGAARFGAVLRADRADRRRALAPGQPNDPADKTVQSSQSIFAGQIVLALGCGLAILGSLSTSFWGDPSASKLLGTGGLVQTDRHDPGLLRGRSSDMSAGLFAVFFDDGEQKHVSKAERARPKATKTRHRADRSDRGASRATPEQINIYLAEAAQEFDLPFALLRAVAMQESRLDPRARSHAGAIGIMQLMPGTARHLGVDPHDVRQNIRGGAAYLRGLLDRFDQNVELAVAAYNAGPGAVIRFSGVPPFRETRRYVANIVGHVGSVPEPRVEAGNAQGAQTGEPHEREADVAMVLLPVAFTASTDSIG